MVGNIRFLVAAMVILSSGGLQARQVKLNPKIVEQAPILHRLIATGDIEELIRVLPTMSNYLNDTATDGETALHWCSHCDANQAAEQLLKFGADVNKADDAGLTPVHAAAKSGNEELTKLFLDNGGDVEVQDTKHGWNAFHWAVYSGNPDLIKRFISEWQEGAQHTTDKRGNDALAVAAIAAATQANQSASDKSRKTAATNYNLKANISILLDAGIDPSASKVLAYIPLDNIEAVSLLLERKADVSVADAQGITPLMRAVAAGNAQAVELFLEHDADINTENMRRMTALNLVDLTKKKNKEMLKLLLRQDIDLDTPSVGMLFNNLIRQNDLELLKLLLAKGIQPTDKNGIKKINPDLVRDEKTFELLENSGLIEDDASADTMDDTSSSRSTSKNRRRNNKIPDFLRDLNSL
ncbi:MAG: ankyrin repeat domain-containing protein, partial [Pseudomonadota bacterium]|nr:ankyrin repeat domain-containing protein [Pseudomonadota bacterium]